MVDWYCRELKSVRGAEYAVTRPVVRQTPRKMQTATKKETKAILSLAGIRRTSEDDVEPPVNSRMRCRDVAAFKARNEYTGYIKRSSLWGWTVKIPSQA